MKKFIINLFTIISIIILILSNISIKATAIESTIKQKPNGYIIYIDVNERGLYLMDKDTKEVIKRYPVAIGRKETPSPLGNWQITGKALKDGPFGGYWLGLNAPWDTFGIHGTSRPDSIGNMASNGCIRMDNYSIQELFNTVEVGTCVIITGGPNFRFSCYSRNIKPHDKGADVYYVQQRLKDLGYFHDYVNGIYDYSLEVAIVNYKEEHDYTDLSTEIDGKFLDDIGLWRFE